MRILLAYSRRHFDPIAHGARRSLSASVLAEAWYTLLSELGEVDYVDALSPPCSLPHAHYDLLVSIQGAVQALCRLAVFDRVILFAVNMPPTVRNELLSCFHRRNRVCPRRHVWHQLVHLSAMDDWECADAVFYVGSPLVADWYRRASYVPPYVVGLNYASALPEASAADRRSAPDGVQLLYVATEMCMRKGFDIFAELALCAKDLGPVHINCLGGAGDRIYRAKLRALCDHMGESMTYHGWVDSASEAYREIIRRCDFILFPSMEEGQAGTVLDAVSQGCIPLISVESGVDIAPLGFVEIALHSEHNRRLIREAVLCPRERIRELSAGVQREYRERYAPWRQHLRAELMRFLAQPAGARAARRRCGGWRSRAAHLLSCFLPDRQWRKLLFNYWRQRL